MSDRLYQILLAEIQKGFPKKSVMVDTLADILHIEKGAVYRRLRQEVPFTFNEIAAIAKQLGISLDGIVGIETERTIPLHSRLPDFVTPQDEDYKLFNFYIKFLQTINRPADNAETVSITNILPLDLFHSFHHLFSFYLFIWNFHYNNDKVKPYKQISTSPKMEHFLSNLSIEAKKLKSSSFVFDNRVFRLIIKDINYFYAIRLIDKEDILKIKEDLFSMLDYLEEIAITGRFKETGNAVNLYISDVDITTNYTYIESQDIYLSIIKIFFISTITSRDKNIFEKMKEWVKSLIKISTLITLTNERHRVLYFEKQRKIINEL
jgi:hypothetical protein